MIKDKYAAPLDSVLPAKGWKGLRAGSVCSLWAERRKEGRVGKQQGLKSKLISIVIRLTRLENSER